MTEHGNWPIFPTEYEKIAIFWRISGLGILADTEFFVLTDIKRMFKMIRTEIGNHTPWESPFLGGHS